MKAPFRIWPLLLAAAVLAGCDAEPQEPSLKEQAAAVRAGKADSIVIEQAILGDADLQDVTRLESLRELLLDSARSRFTAAGIRRLDGLPRLEHLRIRGSGIDDEALQHLASLDGLLILNLPQGTFSDAALAEFKRLPKLQQLRFHSPRVTDAGMQTLAELPALKQLHLINVPITDAGLDVLAQIEQLESLYIDGGQLSDAAVEKLFRERPRLHVHFNQSHHDLDPQKHQH
jgi:hypothetical protein